MAARMIADTRNTKAARARRKRRAQQPSPTPRPIADLAMALRIAGVFQVPPALLGERMAWSLANHPNLNRPLSPHALDAGSRT